MIPSYMQLIYVIYNFQSENGLYIASATIQSVHFEPAEAHQNPQQMIHILLSTHIIRNLSLMKCLCNYTLSIHDGYFHVKTF